MITPHTEISFSDYIVYVDESGDHSLRSVNKQNPVFVLVFCVFEKLSYLSQSVPTVQKLKFDFWGHDNVIFHSRDIRKSHGDFSILLNAAKRDLFIQATNQMIAMIPFTIIATVIDKQRYIQKHTDGANPYAVALNHCVHRLQTWLRLKNQCDMLTHIIVECRGSTEDKQLELEFRRITSEQHLIEPSPQLDIRFMPKKHNSTGLQIADLIAHPIGKHAINPEQSNRAFEIFKPKLWQGDNGEILDYGLKIIP